MTLASDLTNILKPTKLVPAAPGGGIVLRDGQSRMEVRVVDAPATAAAIRLERIGHSSGLRDGPWKRVCDYLLVVESGDRLHAIFIELKKTLTEELRPRISCEGPRRSWRIFGPSAKSSRATARRGRYRRAISSWPREEDQDWTSSR